MGCLCHRETALVPGKLLGCGTTLRNTPKPLEVRAGIRRELIERARELVSNLSQGPPLDRIELSLLDVPNNVRTDEHRVHDAVDLTSFNARGEWLTQMGVEVGSLMKVNTTSGTLGSSEELTSRCFAPP